MVSEPPLASIARDGGRVVLSWDVALFTSTPLFAPIASAAHVLDEAFKGSLESFPQPEHIDAALGPRAGVRFERQRPVSRRRRRGPRAPESMYDARICREGCVPTRPGSWHDLMNALVWATFPRAKRALHARQHSLVVPANPGESARRPPELDTLALLDEGGVIVTGGSGTALADEESVAQAVASGDAIALVFGHAIYEGLALGRPMPLVSVVCVEADTASADEALAAIIADRSRLVEPRQMLRLRLG